MQSGVAGPRAAAAPRATIPQPRRARTITCSAAKRAPAARRPLGYVEQDNSGKANIFAVEPKYVYTSSPRANKVARQGLGGVQGIGVLLFFIAAVMAATVLVSQSSQPLLASSESLAAISERLAATL